MLRIAQCTDSFLPVADGMARVAYEYALALSRRAYECYVITPQKNAGFRGGFPFEIVDYSPFPLWDAAPRRWNTAMLDRHYKARADAIRFDVIHAHGPGSAGIEALRLADRLHAPLVASFHAQSFPDSADGNVFTAADMAEVADFYARCDEVWTDSAESAEVLYGYGYEGDCIIVPNGTKAVCADADSIAQMRETLHLGNEPILLYVGRLSWRRGCRRLLESAALLAREGRSFRLVFVGKGDDADAIRGYAGSLGLSNYVRFPGIVEDQQTLDALLTDALLVLFPSRRDTTSMIMQEAAAAGTPSLVFDTSAAVSVLVHAHNGLICRNTTDSTAAEIRRCLVDPAFAHALGENAKAALPIPWDRAADDAIMRYRRLCARSRELLPKKRGLFRREVTAVHNTLEVRALDLMTRFIKQDLLGLYAYPNRLQKPPFIERPASAPLTRATPESQGVSAAAVQALFEAVDRDELANAHDMLVLRHGKVIGETAWAPYSPRIPHELYSLSKSVTSTAIGLLTDERKLSIDEKLCDMFPEHAPADPAHPVHQFTVRHLLTMSTGTLFNEVGTALGYDWVAEFMRAGVKFRAGTAFEYNSMNTYMLAAVVQRKSGMRMLDYLTPRLFLPLGIHDAAWETCPLGIEKGGWGLSLAIEDVAKIGQLYLNKGVWNVNGTPTQLLSADWIRAATSVQIETPNAECKFGYGYQIWMAPHPGGFLFNGAFGQYMLAIPDFDAVVVLFSGTSRLFAQGGVSDYVEAAFLHVQDAPLPEAPKSQQALTAMLASRSCARRAGLYDDTVHGGSFERLICALDGRMFNFPENIAGVFPVILASVHNNYSTGIRHISFVREEDALCVCLDEGADKNRICFTADGYTFGKVQLRGEIQQIATAAQVELLPSGEWLLRLVIHFLETPFTRILRFSIKSDGLVLLLDEQPTVKDASAMMLDLAGITRSDAFRALLPVLRRDKMQHLLRTYTTVTIEGRI